MAEFDHDQSPAYNKQTLIGDVCVGLIETLRDGVGFCSAAVEQADEVRLRQLCRQMADIREAAILRLAPFAIASHVELPETESVLGWLERALIDTRAMVGETDQELLEYLAILDERTLQELGAADSGLPESDARDVFTQLELEFLDTREAVLDLLRSVSAGSD